MVGPEDILSFWLDEKSPEDWYRGGEELDLEIRERFLGAWETARSGGFSLWLTYPSGTLAYIILADQFGRNMFRGSPESFAMDKAARAAAKVAISRSWDLKIDEPARQFFYMPLMHSENLCDQDRCVRLMCERMPQSRENNLLHARAHREVIRQFGRFPYRNDALDRADTPSEKSYIADGGYGHTLRALESRDKAA